MQRIIGKLPPRILTVLTAVAILWLTLAPRPLGDMETQLFPGADKVAHAIMFGGLALMAYVDESRSRRWSRLSPAYIAVTMLAVAAFGVVIEFLQDSIDTGRTFDINDIWADTAGAVLAALLWFLFTRSRYGRENYS